MIPVSRPYIGRRERRAVNKVLRSGMLAQGPEVEKFENEFSEQLVNGAFSIAVNSGTSALHLSMLALGISAGDEVIVPSFTFAATANSVVLTGATPIFADINLKTFCIDPDSVKKLIGPRTKAVIAVHLYGQSCDMTSLSLLCKANGLYLIEDAAQAHGAKWLNKPVGTWGTVGCFSFYPTKNMTSGEGGMITTFDSNLADLLRLLRNQGQKKRYHNEVIGLNNRMTDIHAALGRVQLSRLSRWNDQRREIAATYSDQLVNVQTPYIAEEAFHVFHQYTIKISEMERNLFAEELKKSGILTGVYYPIPVHKLPSYNKNIELPNTAEIALQCLSLPIFPTLRKKEIEKVIRVVNGISLEKR